MKSKTGFFILTVMILGLVAFFCTFQSGLRKKSISSDAQGYYAYLPAFFIYQDFSMEKVDLYHPEASFLEFPAIYKSTKTARNLPKYPLGVSVLLLPFFLLAQGLSLLFKLPATGYTLLYQHLVGMAGVFYLGLGLYFLSKFYNNFFQKQTTLLTLILLVLSTNLFHYAVYESLMSHVYSFSLASIFLFLLFGWQKKAGVKNSLALGLVLGLMFLVRNLNIFYALLLLPFLKNNSRQLKYLLLSFLITIFPQLLYWQYASGQFLYYSYQGEGFNFLDPRIKGFLFSYRRGLFFWSPVFFFSLGGFYKLKQKIGKLFYGVLSVLLVILFLASSWSQWAYGGGFGNRALIDLYPLLGLGLANFYQQLAGRGWVKNIVYGLTVVFIVLNLTNMIKYWQGIIPPDHVTLEGYLNSFFVFKR